MLPMSAIFHFHKCNNVFITHFSLRSYISGIFNIRLSHAHNYLCSARREL